MGLAGSVFAYLMASSGITSRQNLSSAEAKYAAKSGIEIAMHQLKNNVNGKNFSSIAPAGVSCPNNTIIPPGVTLSLSSSSSYQYIYGNLAPNYSIDNYTPSFCALVAQGQRNTGGAGGGCNNTYYIITSNGFAGGTEREITAEVGIGNGKNPNSTSCTGIYVESEPPNSN